MKKSLTMAACAALALGAVGALAQSKAGDAMRGKDVFESNCSVCHNADSTERKMGPGLKGLFKRETLANKKKVTDANVLEMIEKGSPTGMPSFADQLSDQEKADVIAYLKTL